jgi:hypothetical protein
MQEGRGPATPVLTDAGLRGAVVIVTGGGSGIGLGYLGGAMTTWPALGGGTP